MAAKGSALKGALAAAPRSGRVTSLPVGKPSAVVPGAVQAATQAALGGGNLQRLSPGVYRNQQGQLVNSQGGSLPGQRQQPQRPPMHVQPGVVNGMLPGASSKPPTWRPPAPNLQAPPTWRQQEIAGNNMAMDQFKNLYPKQYVEHAPADSGMYYMGGSANFNEQTGQYNDPAQAAANIAQRQAYAQQMGQQYNPMQAPQRYPAQQQGIQPDMQMQYGMTGKPIGYGYGQNQS